jgi:hypothetical protein
MSKLKLKQGHREEKTHNHNNKPTLVSRISRGFDFSRGVCGTPERRLISSKEQGKRKKGSEPTEKGPRGLSFQEARFFSLPVFALSRVSTVLVQPSRDLSAVVRPCVPFSFSPTVQ